MGLFASQAGGGGGLAPLQDYEIASPVAGVEFTLEYGKRYLIEIDKVPLAGGDTGILGYFTHNGAIVRHAYESTSIYTQNTSYFHAGAANISSGSARMLYYNMARIDKFKGEIDVLADGKGLSLFWEGAGSVSTGVNFTRTDGCMTSLFAGDMTGTLKFHFTVAVGGYTLTGGRVRMWEVT